MVSCGIPSPTRRRIFWTTQPDACGSYTQCNSPCGIPGLKYEDEAAGRRIATNDWVQSLVLNILNTRARAPRGKCLNVGAPGGHWSESYREDNMYTGTRIWNELSRPSARIQDTVKLLNAQLKADVGKLVKLGVASEIDVKTEYKGSNRIVATVTIIGPTIGETTISLTSERFANEWVWR